MFELVLLALATAATAGPTGKGPQIKCGYDSCTPPTEGFLNVHIVPHTHDDVGWLKTVDQYYYGNRNDIQKAGVQYIIDSVVKELWEDPKRRFIYVETAFFWKWWTVQPDSVKTKVDTLVKEGRLKFVGGAWSMNDEADTYYQTTIDQFTWGLSKLRDTFGDCGRPLVGWQIDPFGHSREFASLLAAMGYDGLFLGRIDYQDKLSRAQERRMEMVWRGDDSLGKYSDIFTGVLYNTYSPPPGFCFDVLCSDEPIIDDPNSPDYNVDRRVNDFLNLTKHMSRAYATNNLLVTMGEDFQYQEAGMWYKNLDKLIQYGNLKAAKDGMNITMYYSTPDCYLKAVKDATPSLPIKQDDFFPYASDPHAYWTGYFTSRPTVKYLDVITNNYLQAVKQLQVLGALPGDNVLVLNELKSAMGVMQHHDAVTGTEKQHVTKDYVRMVSQAVEDAHVIVTQALNRNIFGVDATIQLNFDRCQFNESRCKTSEEAKGNIIVTIYNPLGWPVKSAVNIPIVDGEYEVKDGDGKIQTVQIAELSETVLKMPSRLSKAKKELTFIANLPPLGYKSYYMSKVTAKTKRDVKYAKLTDIDEYFEKIRHQNFANLAIESEFDDNVVVMRNIPDEPKKSMYYNFINSDKKAKALLKSKSGAKDKNVEEFEKLFVEKKKPERQRKEEIPYPSMSAEEMRMLSDDPMVIQRFDDQLADEAHQEESQEMKLQKGNYTMTFSYGYYPAAIGDNVAYENRSSGAYIFRPKAVTPTEIKIKDKKTITGPLFTEYRFATDDNAEFTYRLYNHARFYEFKYVIGPIDIDDGVGKEYIIRYNTDIITNGEFYTDSNGRQLLKRKLDKRPQWNVTIQEPVAGNYYPVVGVIGVKNDDGDVFVNVLPDRAVGASSLLEGSIEVMLHRRLLHDDAFGVGEALNETEAGKGLVVRGTHRFYFDSNPIKFKEVIEMKLQPQVFVSDATGITFDDWKKLTNEKSWLKAPLPEGVHFLTLEPFDEPEKRHLLIRLENYLDESESSTRVVDLAELLTFTSFSWVGEMCLAADRGNRNTDERWSWDKDEEFSENFNEEYGSFNTTRRARDRTPKSDDGYKISLTAKQIRTFIVGI